MNTATTQSSIDYYQDEQPRKAPSSKGNHELNPKGNIVKPVPRIKRPRSSRKTPATLLNTDINNFRTLVQQYTGCQQANSSFLKMASNKGPINLNFATQGRNDEENNDDNVKTISIGSNTTTSNGFGYNVNDEYYQETETSQLMLEDHQTFSSTRTVSDISLPDLLSAVDDHNFMENTCFSW